MMRLISNAIDRRKVWKEIHSCPVYSPPFHDAENVLAKHEIKANHDYFLAQKADRVKYLTRYLVSFSLVLRLERDSIQALDDWLYRYGGHLLPRELEPRQGSVITAMHDHEPQWFGPFRGLNLVNDIAIFVGDYLISKDSAVSWDINYGNGRPRDYERIGFGHPCLVGLWHLPKGEHYPLLGLAEIFDYCRAGWWRLKGNVDIMWRPGELLRRIDYLSSDTALISPHH